MLNNTLKQILKKNLEKENLDYKLGEKIFDIIFRFIKNTLLEYVYNKDFLNYKFRITLRRFMNIESKKKNNLVLLKQKEKLKNENIDDEYII